MRSLNVMGQRVRTGDIMGLTVRLYMLGNKLIDQVLIREGLRRHAGPG